MTMGEEPGLHGEEDVHEVGIDGGEMGLALIDGEGREPFEDGGSRVRARVRA